MPSNHVPSRKGNSGGAYLKTFLEQLDGSGPEGWGDRLFLEGAREWQRLRLRTLRDDDRMEG